MSKVKMQKVGGDKPCQMTIPADSLDMLKSAANAAKLLSVAFSLDWKKKHRLISKIIERVTTEILCLLTY